MTTDREGKVPTGQARATLNLRKDGDDDRLLAIFAPGPLAARLRASLRLPDVVADPEQAHENRVWTRARDVLPGVVVREETAMTAAWGDQVWTVLPAWDEDDVEGLWLENLDQPAGPPTLDEVYPRAELLRRIGQSDHAAGEAILTWVLDDFADCLTVTAQAQRRLRHWAATLLDDLERLAPSVVRDLDELASGRDLRALARRPAS